MPREKQFNIRMTEEEYARIERLRERLQARERPDIEISQRTTIMRAVEALERRLDDLEADKGRKR